MLNRYVFSDLNGILLFEDLFILLAFTPFNIYKQREVSKSKSSCVYFISRLSAINLNVNSTIAYSPAEYPKPFTAM